MKIFPIVFLLFITLFRNLFILLTISFMVAIFLKKAIKSLEERPKVANLLASFIALFGFYIIPDIIPEYYELISSRDPLLPISFYYGRILEPLIIPFLVLILIFVLVESLFKISGAKLSRTIVFLLIVTAMLVVPLLFLNLPVIRIKGIEGGH